MLVRELMTRAPWSCTPEDTLEAAARVLWDHDLGALPVISGAVTVAMITDRDICMAAYTQGRPLRELLVNSAMSRELCSVQPDDDLDVALEVMRARQVRRLAVIDDQGRLQGVLSINDVTQAAASGLGVSPELVADTLASIGRSRATPRRHAAREAVASA